MKFLVSILVLALLSITNSLIVQNNSTTANIKNVSLDEGKVISVNTPEELHVIIHYHNSGKNKNNKLDL